MEQLGIVVVLAILGYLFGSAAERRHFASIREREQRYSELLTFSTRTLPTDPAPATCGLVSGNVVISIDYFKRLTAGLRGIIGGRVTAFETLVDRARREALLRLKEDAHSQGMSMVFNVRLETSSISKGNSKQLGTIEVYAYGTGVQMRR
jgi:uncharacterized protein YbjQ (UPF0145 family)